MLTMECRCFYRCVIQKKIALCCLGDECVPFRVCSFCHPLSPALNKRSTYHSNEIFKWNMHWALREVVQPSDTLQAVTGCGLTLNEQMKSASHRAVHIKVLYNTIFVCVRISVCVCVFVSVFQVRRGSQRGGGRPAVWLSVWLAHTQSGLRLRAGKMANCFSLSVFLSGFLSAGLLSVCLPACLTVCL